MAKKSKKSKNRDTELLSAQYKSAEAFFEGRIEDAIEV